MVLRFRMRDGGRTWRSRPAFSIVEVIVVITILGVLAALMIPAFRELIPSSKATTAQSNLELLNQSVLKFNQANWELVLSGSDSDAANAMLIARSVQYRSTAPGSPYLDPTLTMMATDGTDTYRASWDGRMFEMIDAGTAGSGLDLLQMSSSGSSYSFPNGYKPVGAP